VDILTEVIASIRTGAPRSTRTQARAPFALRLRPTAGPGFHVVLQGSCWLIAPGEQPVALAPGDVAFLRDGREHVLADDPGTPAQEFHQPSAQEPFRIGRIDLAGPGARTVMLCGSYDLEQGRPHPLISGLPPIIHLPAVQGRYPELRSAIDLLGAELENDGQGAEGIIPPLIEILLFYILRAWLEARAWDLAPGWTAALADPATSRALRAIHEQPARHWSVETLGELTGLSRAAFSKRFATLVGEPPLTYVTRWRMTIAGKLLRESDAPLSAIAARTGYASEFAFAKAFKREYGVSPGGYRRGMAATTSRQTPAEAKFG
jgi:AraC-like DNA-binding protein